MNVAGKQPGVGKGWVAVMVGVPNPKVAVWVIWNTQVAVGGIGVKELVGLNVGVRVLVAVGVGVVVTEADGVAVGDPAVMGQETQTSFLTPEVSQPPMTHIEGPLPASNVNPLISARTGKAAEAVTRFQVIPSVEFQTSFETVLVPTTPPITHIWLLNTRERKL